MVQLKLPIFTFIRSVGLSNPLVVPVSFTKLGIYASLLIEHAVAKCRFFSIRTGDSYAVKESSTINDPLT